MDWNKLIGVFTFGQWLILAIVLVVLAVFFIKATKPKKIGPIEYNSTSNRKRRRRS